MLHDASAAGVPVIAQFSAAWCKPCAAIKPVFASLAASALPARFAYLNLDVFDEEAAAAGVSAIPHFVVYREGRKTSDLLAPSEDVLRAFVAQHAEFSAE